MPKKDRVFLCAVTKIYGRENLEEKREQKPLPYVGVEHDVVRTNYVHYGTVQYQN